MSPIRKKGIKFKQRTKIVIAVVLFAVVVMGISYANLRERTAQVQREQHQIERKIEDAKDKKKELKKEKKYINTKEFVEKMAREKFGLFYPDEYVLENRE